MRLKSILAAGIAAVMVPMAGNVAAAADGPPIANFAIREVIQQAQVSPDGSKLVLLRNDSKDGDPIIEIYETANLSKPPVRLQSDPMEFSFVQWASDDLLLGQSRQIVRRRIRGPEQDVRRYKLFGYSVSKEKFNEFPGNFGIASLLPEEPDKILVSLPRGNAAYNEDDPFAGFRPWTYYKLNLATGAKSLVMKGSEDFPQASFDSQGRARYTQGLDLATKEIVAYYRGIDDKSWNEVGRLSGKDESIFRDSITPVLFRDDDTGVVLARNGHDLIGAWEYDFRAGEFGELIYRDDEADVTGVRTDPNVWGGKGDEIEAFVTPGDGFELAWTDAEAKALHEQLMAAIPNAHTLSISSMSRDGQTFTVSNRGPRDPGSSYLVVNGALQKLGSANPLLKAEDLSDVQYIKYQARDGRTIPAYLTMPKGEAPFPLIVLPHGGPYVNEVITYDEWGQFLASRGYMVLQPQYRGSEGHGFDHFFSSLNEHGGAMQDDKDDGALHLVREGMVDPDRIAMFGWSYGGYAALVAASRDPQIYQCVIAGAAVADPMLSYNGRRNDTIPFSDTFARQRGSHNGINPMNEVDKVNVPVLLVHGDVDRRVIYEHFTKYRKALQKAGKTFDELTLEQADHFYNTLYYNHQEDLYKKLETFLSEDCGPGGL